ncbi:hypothetical protein KY290_001092 [Solanum tuberosum]|uniref:Uncharacterized protein n=1 Tax=Solanum tuberosum TaxID=4113 RepID=A0ABQ7WL65_SOLTU|nr:hypothetical protein KY290_001092 [Solanum tuberosum]
MYLLEVCDKSKISLYGHRVFFYVLCDRLFKLEEGAMHIGVLFICKQVSCTREWHHENRTITSSFIERKHLNEIGSNRNGSLANFRDRVSVDLRAKVTLSQVKRGKRKAISLLDGDIKDQFKMKWDYCNEIDRKIQEIQMLLLGVMKKEPSQWTMAYFSSDAKSDMLLNNVCEVYNSMILDARDKTILTLLEKLRYLLMARMLANREKAEQ